MKHSETDKYIWVYNKNSKSLKAPTKHKSIKSVAWSDDYYAMENNDGSIDFSLEVTHLQEADNFLCQTIKKITSCNSEFIDISAEDKGKLAFCISLLFCRTPSIREPIELFHKKILEASVSMIELPPYPLTGESFYRSIINGDISIDIKQWVSLKPMLVLAEKLAYSILSKPWLFHRIKGDNHFFTGDNPVIFNPGFDGAGPVHPDSEIAFPLNKKWCLVCSLRNGYKNMSIINTNEKFIKRINQGIAQAAKNQVYTDCQSDKIARLVYNNRGKEQTILIS